MNVLLLIYKEIVHRKVNFLLSLLAVVTAVALFVAFFTTGEGAKRETTRLMRDLGFNVRIVPKETDMEAFWASGYSAHTMPEEYVQRFANQDNIAFNHLLATLHHKGEWNGRTIIMTGLASGEVIAPGRAKSVMSTTYAVEPGTVFIGHEVGRADGLKAGDTMELEGRSFIVKKRLTETGTADDIRVYLNLADAQSLLGLEGLINELKALDCMCNIPGKDTLEVLRDEIERLLPETKVIQIRDIAVAREKQRLMSERYFALIVPLVIIVAAAWIGALAAMNVRDRRSEIGVLRALGHGSERIAALFLGKAIIVGLLGALIGYALGTWVALEFGARVFQLTAGKLAAIPWLLFASLAAAPAFAALSSFIPAMMAVTQDPAQTLREE